MIQQGYNIDVYGDVIIEMVSKGKKLFRLSFNTSFLDMKSKSENFKKSEIDKAFKNEKYFLN
jgi:hypothetical protein